MQTDSNLLESLRRWDSRIRFWVGMFAGTSYFHQPQGLGLKFVGSELGGYFNDLTGKASWPGSTDPEGLPVLTLSNGHKINFPITLCQKALGHWDLWLMHAREEDRKGFLDVARWLRERQDDLGGWDTWGPFGKPPIHRYSAMAQGQALSVMSRAYSLTGENAYESACRRALVLMSKPVQDGGVCHYEGNEVILEEFPGPERDTVLNGWLFAIFGIRDFLLAFPDDGVQAFYDATRASVLRALVEFDAGYWSYYSSGTRRLASPFYHRLHISQLEALALITDDDRVRTLRAAWSRCEANTVWKSKAIMVKVIQKLREAPGVIPLN